MPSKKKTTPDATIRRILDDAESWRREERNYIIPASLREEEISEKKAEKRIALHAVDARLTSILRKRRSIDLGLDPLDLVENEKVAAERAEAAPLVDVPLSDETIAARAAIESVVSTDFARGARAAAESMRYYFLNENEASMYVDLSERDLESFEASAVLDTIREEAHRIERETPAATDA